MSHTKGVSRDSAKVSINDLAIMSKNAFDSIEKRFDDIEKRMTTKADLNSGLNSLRVELKKDNQNTRDYVDKRINELSGTMVTYDKAILGKVDTLVDTLERKQILNSSESSSIKHLSPFPNL